MKLELAPQFIQDIDWELLKNQKHDLLLAIDDFEIAVKSELSKGKRGKKGYVSRLTETINSIKGIIHIIDGIQDYAVDICEVPEEKVFNIQE